MALTRHHSAQCRSTSETGQDYSSAGEDQCDPETLSATASVMILELIFFRLSQAKSVKQEAEAKDVASSPGRASSNLEVFVSRDLSKRQRHC